MDQWKNLINKYCKIIFEDGENHYSKKIGIILDITPTHLILSVNSHQEALNLSKILRIEEIVQYESKTD